MTRTVPPRCKACARCDGRGCPGELPGMGGVHSNANFRRNFDAWENAAASCGNGNAPLPALRLAPMTGGVENVGYRSERDFYFDLIGACLEAGVEPAVGDGVPDEKLRYGLEALAHYRAKGGVFLKPYADAEILRRMEEAAPQALYFGVDIDAWNIVTMRGLARLEKKNAASLQKLKQQANAAGLPFAVKGIFLPEETGLAEEVRPDILVVSNHGGRVETRDGSTAEFLAAYGPRLAPFCGEIWVDGGIRTFRHRQAAGALGAASVLVGRPFAISLLFCGAEGVRETARMLRGETEGNPWLFRN